jgi:tRNA 2-thiocytidine biosynthesis protein TtcA
LNKTAKTIPQNYFGRLCRASIEFDLIEKNDKILIGLSGGKDSLFLTYALAFLRDHAAFPFELAAFTLDPMFSNDFDTDILGEFCADLSIPFHTDQVDIAGIIAQNNGKDPCFSCAFFRRGAINQFAVKNGFNKVAYAHHHDDAVETFFMGLLYAGQLKTFLPKTYLDRTGITVIRPLIYFREYELKDTHKIHGLKPLPSPCPYNGKTKRQEIKEMICELEKTNSAVYSHLTAAMRCSREEIELWPSEIHREVLKVKHFAFWHKDKPV